MTTQNNNINTPGIYPHARINEAGELSFPHRGDPPKFVIQGYIQDHRDLYVYKPILKPCMYRANAWKKACGGMKQTISCALFKINVNVGDCLACTEQKPPTSLTKETPP